MFSMAGVTSHTKEAVLKTTAFEVILEFPPHIIRQHPALGDPLCRAYFDMSLRGWRPLLHSMICFVFSQNTRQFSSRPVCRQASRNRIICT